MLQATRFFVGFLPSFTNLGYLARRALWQQEAWDFSGQHWLVSGASTGIGREIARQAAAAGATVLAVARSEDKLARLAEEAENLPGSIHAIPLDLSLVASTERLINQVLAPHPALNVLVNNVGVLLNTSSTTAEGLDAGFATNLLNPWLAACTTCPCRCRRWNLTRTIRARLPMPIISGLRWRLTRTCAEPKAENASTTSCTRVGWTLQAWRLLYRISTEF